MLGKGAEARGKHACGFAGYDIAENMFELCKVDHEFTGSDIVGMMGAFPIVIGHTRFATVGEHTVENAHPFDYRHIIGAHNGGVYNHDELAKKYDKRKFNVDSQHLIGHIANGHDTKELRGYGAVTWFDKREPGVVYICRMNRGELQAEELEGGGIVWASTREILIDALRLLGLFQKSKAVTFSEGAVYRITRDGEVQKTARVIKLDNYEFAKPASTPSVTAQAHCGTGAFGSHGGYSSPPLPKTYQGGRTRVWTPSAHWQDIDDYRRASKSANSPASGKQPGKRGSRRGTTKGEGTVTDSDYRKACAAYDRDLDQYLRAVENGAVTTPCGKGKAVRESALLFSLVTDMYSLAGKAQEELQAQLNEMTRRKRRKHTKLALTAIGHPRTCQCHACCMIENLVNEILDLVHEHTPMDA